MLKYKFPVSLYIKIPPSVFALFVQVFAVFVAFFIFYLARLFLAVTLPPLLFISLVASTAVVTSYLARFDWWWLFIQALFPFGVLVCFAINIAAHFYLIIFSVFLLLYWSTFRTQVPYYPSKASLISTLLGQLPGGSIKFVDVGSGFGGVVVKLSKFRPDCEFTGIEIAPLPWLISWIRGRVRKGSVKFQLGDYSTVNFSNFDVVFAYLSPAAMPPLWEKIRREMRPGSTFMSYEFIIPNVQPDLFINGAENGPMLYVWRI